MQSDSGDTTTDDILEQQQRQNLIRQPSSSTSHGNVVESRDTSECSSESFGIGKCHCHSLAFTVYTILLIGWLVGGAFVFKYLEQGQQNENIQTPPINTVSFDNIADINDFTKNKSISIVNVSVTLLNGIQMLKIDYYDKSKSDFNEKWNFAGSLFFCISTLATIGYGSLFPITKLGKLICVIYALVGMPIFIVVAAELRRCFVNLICKYLVFNCGQSNRNRWKRAIGSIFVVSFSFTATFIIAPAFLFSWVEGWSLLESLYFGFISLTSIGFGDFIAGMSDNRKYFSGFIQNKYWQDFFLQMYRIFLSCYLFFGLIFAASLFGTVQEFLTRKMNGNCFHKRNLDGYSATFGNDNESRKSIASSSDHSVMVVVSNKP